MIAWYWLLLLMIFAHTIEDFHLQGILAELKQKSYWRGFNTFYHQDYIPALIFHGFEWSFIVHIPLIWAFGFEPIVFLAILFNAGIHSRIDHWKCNEKSINLIQDQIFHMCQIVLTLIIVEFVIWV